MTPPQSACIVLFPFANALWAQATFQPDPLSALMNLGAAGIMATMLWILLREQAKQFREDMRIERESSRTTLDGVHRTFKDALDAMVKEVAAERADRQRHHDAHLSAIQDVQDVVNDLSSRVPPIFPASRSGQKKESQQ